MTLSLGTSTVLALLSGDPPVIRDRFTAAVDAGEDVRISTIVLHELAFAVHEGDRPQAGMRALDEFLTAVTVEPFEAADALEAARLRRQLGDFEGEVSTYGLLIVAQAISRGWTLVTLHIERAGVMAGTAGQSTGLSLMDWSVSDAPVDYSEMIRDLRLKRAK